MARDDAGFTYIEEHELIDFTNAILELAVKNCENFLEDMVKIKCSNQQIYGASQVIEVVKSMKVKL